ncbi:MAG TPA: DUF4399 domain-containing protein [Gammaproteobacteria bacterium]|nr:DUF4399 domain-containing protein [Gammaproteobacteria bacterium]
MLIRLLTISCLLLTAACGQEETAAPAAEATPEAAAEAPAAMPQRTAAPPGAMAYIISPSDGATVDSPVRVLFGLEGAGVVPAGIEFDNAGHHHLLIDAGLPDLDSAIPADTNHRHFGGGQTEVEIELEPGSHTLQLLLGDAGHIPHNPPIMSEQITIEVR